MARPGAHVDALTRLAALLCQLAAHGGELEPDALLQQVGLAVECQLLDVGVAERATD